MSIESKQKILWSDIVELYSTLNTARKNFSYTTLTIPSNQNVSAKASDIDTLNSFVKEMSSNSILSSITTGITSPTKGSLISSSPINTLKTQIETAAATCNFGNSSFGNSSFGRSSFGDTSFSFCSFSRSSFGNTSFSDSSFSNSSFSNSGFGNSSFSNSGFGDSSFGNSSFSNTSFSNTSFSCSSFRFSFNSSFSNSSFGNSSRTATDMGGFTCY